MKNKIALILMALVTAVFVTSCANNNRPINETEHKQFVEGCVPSCVKSATTSNPTAPKEMVDKYCKSNCECTADGIKKDMTVAQMQAYMKNQAGPEGKQVNEIIQKCMSENTPGK